MKNHREFLGVIANVFLVVIVLLIIVIGLNKIGVYSLPSWVEKLISEDDETKAIGSEDDFEIYNSLKDNESNKSLSSISLTFENADAILKKLKPTPNYSQTIYLESIYENNKLNETVFVTVNDSMYNASVFNSYGMIKKQIIEEDNGIKIVDYNDGNSIETLHQKGSFNVYEECGFVLDVDNFLASDFALSDATFVLTENESFGSVMTVSFESSYETLKQVEQYTISLDFGVVVSAFCYQGDSLIYAMTTSELNVI